VQLRELLDRVVSSLPRSRGRLTERSSQQGSELSDGVAGTREVVQKPQPPSSEIADSPT
jgi:hypothetical protein